MGYCKVCGKLVSTRPGERQAPNTNFTSQWWYPVSHDGPDGKPCDGDKARI